MIELHAANDVIVIVNQLELAESLDHSRSVEVVTEIRVVETIVFEVKRDVLGPRRLEYVVIVSGVVRLAEMGRDQLLSRSVYLGKRRDRFILV